LNNRRRRPPPLPANSPGKPDGARYREQYGVVIVCPDEATQQAVYAGLRSLAPCRLKVVVT
jgi:hypothetical protein